MRHLHFVEENAVLELARVSHHNTVADDHVLAHVATAADPAIFADPWRVHFGLSFVSRTSQPGAEIWSRSPSLRFQFFSRLAFSRSFASCATSVGIMISTSASRSRTVLIRFHQSSHAFAETTSSLF